MPKKIILVRHGETDYNKEKRIQGWLDIPLNTQGRAQAKLSAQKLLDISIDYIYSSDLKRAHETAQIISTVVRQKITTVSALRERDMGIFAGWAWEKEVDPQKEELWREFENARDIEDLGWNKHQGESMHQMSQRISAFMQNLHILHTDQTILVVTHGGTINRILEHYQLKETRDGYKEVKNASLLVLNKSLNTYTLEEL